MTGILLALVFVVVGLAVSRLVGPMQPWLAGAGATGLVLYLAGVVHLPLVPIAIVLLLASAAVAFRRPRIRFESKEPLADALLAITAIVLFALVAILPLTDYDGRAFWLLKAKAIAHEGRIDGPFFQGQSAINARNSYPLLVPLDAALLMKAAGELDERHTRGLYVLFAVAFALEIRRRLGAWPAVLFLWLPQVMIDNEGGVLSAYNDIAVAAFAGCAFFELVEASSPLRFGLWLSFLTLTKNEGLPFAMLLLAIGIFVFRKRIAIAALPLVPAIAALFVWRSRVARTDEEDLFALLLRLPERLDRFGEATVPFARHFAVFGDWGLFWIAVLIAAGVLAWRRQWRVLALAAAAMLPMLALYDAVYMVTNWNTLDLVNSTASRLLLHLVGPALVVFSAALERSR